MFYCDRCETDTEINCNCGYYLYLSTRTKFEDIYQKCKNNIFKIFSHDLNKYIYKVTISVGINNYEYNLDINIDKLEYNNALQQINFIKIKLEDISEKNNSFKLNEDFKEIRNKYDCEIKKTQKLFVHLLDILNEFKNIH